MPCFIFLNLTVIVDSIRPVGRTESLKFFFGWLVFAHCGCFPFYYIGYDIIVLTVAIELINCAEVISPCLFLCKSCGLPTSSMELQVVIK